MANDWPPSQEFWRMQRVVVTGGAGFLGRYVVEKLRERGCQHVFVPRSATCDLRREADIVRLFEESRPDIVIHQGDGVPDRGNDRLQGPHPVGREQSKWPAPPVSGRDPGAAGVRVPCQQRFPHRLAPDSRLVSGTATTFSIKKTVSACWRAS